MMDVDQGLSKRDIDRQGLCHQTEYKDYWPLFFADTAFERRPARNLCGEYGKPNVCPVREQCLKWALENKEIWGIWGGCDESELRRALSVDANGDQTERCRYPHCPNCKARPSKLFVLGICELKTGRKRERVECQACGFSWRASTSVAAVKSYWRERRKQVRARATRGRLPDVRQRAQSAVSLPGALPEENLVNLAASARP